MIDYLKSFLKYNFSSKKVLVLISHTIPVCPVLCFQFRLSGMLWSFTQAQDLLNQIFQPFSNTRFIAVRNIFLFMPPPIRRIAEGH